MNPRIVSLLPSATELLGAVGGERLLAGRSHACDWPPSVTDRPALTRRGEDGSWQLDEALLKELRPDVILCAGAGAAGPVDPGDVARVAAELTSASAPTLVRFDPVRVEDVFDDLLRVGEAAGLTSAAEAAMVRLREEYWSAIDYVNPYVDGPTTLLLEWLDPPVVGGRWTAQLVEAAGGRQPLMAPGAPSRQLALEEIVASQPERLVVAPCGMSLEEGRRELERVRRQRWFGALPAVVENQVALVDGRLFSRPGPRLVAAFRWLVGWLNGRPEVAPKEFPALTPAFAPTPCEGEPPAAVRSGQAPPRS